MQTLFIISHSAGHICYDPAENSAEKEVAIVAWGECVPLLYVWALCNRTKTGVWEITVNPRIWTMHRIGYLRTFCLIKEVIPDFQKFKELSSYIKNRSKLNQQLQIANCNLLAIISAVAAVYSTELCCTRHILMAHRNEQSVDNCLTVHIL